MILRRAAISVVAAIFLLEIVAALGNLDPSGAAAWIQTMAWWPGIFLAALVYPEGIHTGEGSIGFPLLAYAVTLLIHGAAIYLLLMVVSWVGQAVGRGPDSLR